MDIAKKTLADFKRMLKEEEERKATVEKITAKMPKKDVDALVDEGVLDLEFQHLANLKEEIPRQEKIVKKVK